MTLSLQIAALLTWAAGACLYLGVVARDELAQSPAGRSTRFELVCAILAALAWPIWAGLIAVLWVVFALAYRIADWLDGRR